MDDNQMEVNDEIAKKQQSKYSKKPKEDLEKFGGQEA